MIIPACLPAHGHGTPAAHRSAPHPQAVAAARRWARSSPCTLRLCGRTRYVHRYLLYTLYFTLYTLYHPDNTGCIIQYYTIIRIIHNTPGFLAYLSTLEQTDRQTDRQTIHTTCPLQRAERHGLHQRAVRHGPHHRAQKGRPSACRATQHGNTTIS